MSLKEGDRVNLRVIQGGRSGRPRRLDERRIAIVVDDEELSRELLGSVLKRINSPLVEIHEFADPGSALSFAHGREVDLALIDLHLGAGQMNGLELVDRIRAETPAGDRFSAILITADTEPMIVYEAMLHHVAVVMEKAVNLYRLALHCCALLRIPPPREE